MADIDKALDTGALTSAEKQLIECCKTGRACTLGDGTRPTTPSDARTIHADLLRYLITGGCEDYKVHDQGVQLQGAFVQNVLDLSYASARGATVLECCHFLQKINAQYCHFSTLSLQGSCLEKGLYAQGIFTVGSVFLRNGFSAKACVDLNNAKIGGQLSCTKGQFQVEKGLALDLQDTQVADFFWRLVTEISGGLDLTGAHFGSLVDDPNSWELVNDLFLIGLTYDHITNPGDTRKRLEWLSKGDQINGEFSPQPYTQLAKVLRSMGHDRDARSILIEGEARHRSSEWAEIESLRAERGAMRRFLKSPDSELWQAYINSDASSQSQLIFERFRNVCLNAPLEHPNRPTDEALALGRIGLRRDFQILNAQDKLRIWGLKVRSLSLRWLIGYGFQPFNSLWALVILTFLAAGFSQKAWLAGDFAPNSDVILSTPDWQTLAETDSIANPAHQWSDTHGKGRDYESFNALAYGFDIVVPIVNIGQEAAWSPSTTRGIWGWNLWWMRWVFTVVGWVVTALGAAAITGIIRRE
ncbi:hypothetical protein [Pseudophaeobacter sp.]|uniref:hypothetical protein n=1 Tax=Pseudophaeobacter sp. TaxID=1971739 RepID=UPI00329953F3